LLCLPRALPCLPRRLLCLPRRLLCLPRRLLCDNDGLQTEGMRRRPGNDPWIGLQILSIQYQ
jgi:hypothetical protein